MLERKNIDRVFRENLKDLEIYPSKNVWMNIEKSLLENHQKKTIPLWRKLSGIAIIFMLFFSGGVFYYFSNSSSGSTIEDANSTRATVEVTSSDIEIINTETIPTLINIAQTKEKVRVALQKENGIFVKKANNNVITTSTDITTIYKTIENKYVVNKDAFLVDLKSNEDALISIIEADELNKIENSGDSKKWSVGTTFSPVYYNSLSSGSPINEALAENVKSADDAVSLGLKINYQLTNKINLQSGINKVELAYNTKNVNATISSAKFAANNINTNKTGVSVLPNSSTELGGLGASADTRNKSNLNGDLNQSIEYFEFPLELKYNIFESKIGLNVIGGISTFILTNNSVSIVSQNNSLSLGEANNLNSVNFSGNFGVDLDYKINSNWYLNVAPMFKYQFNTFNNSSGNFQPYYLGVYSGLNYRF